MLMKTLAGVVIAVSATLLSGCGDDSGEESSQVNEGCTEREGTWFARAGNTFISSPTQEGCEERLRQ